MTVKTIASVKADFEAGDVPTAAQFVDLIDSTYSGEIGAAIVAAASAGGVGLINITSASAVTIVTAGTAGLAVLEANTEASARTAIDVTAASTAKAGLIEIATTAEAVAGTDAAKAMTPATQAAVSTTSLPRSHLTGLVLSNGTDATNDINIAIGEAQDTANTTSLSITTAIGKQIDVTWAAGGTTATPTGGLSSSLTLTNDTKYAVILGLVSGTVEVGFDTSATGANLVTDHSFTNTRRIGWIQRLTGANQLIVQTGDRVDFVDTLLDASFTMSATAANATLTVPPSTEAIIRVSMAVTADAGEWAMLVYPTDITAEVPSVTNSQLYSSSGTSADQSESSGDFRIRVDASSQVAHDELVNGTRTATIRTVGYIDRRGRDD